MIFSFWFSVWNAFSCFPWVLSSCPVLIPCLHLQKQSEPRAAMCCSSPYSLLICESMAAAAAATAAFFVMLATVLCIPWTENRLLTLLGIYYLSYFSPPLTETAVLVPPPPKKNYNDFLAPKGSNVNIFHRNLSLCHFLSPGFCLPPFPCPRHS